MKLNSPGKYNCFINPLLLMFTSHNRITMAFHVKVPKEGAWYKVSDLLENRQIDRPFSAE